MIPHDSWVFHIYSIYISIYFYIFLLFSYFSWDIYGKFMVLFRWIFLCQVNELCSKMNLVLPPSRWFPLPPRCPFWRRPQHDVWRKGSLEDDLRKCNFWRKWSEDLCISDISIIFNHFQYPQYHFIWLSLLKTHWKPNSFGLSAYVSFWLWECGLLGAFF